MDVNLQSWGLLNYLVLILQHESLLEAIDRNRSSVYNKGVMWEKGPYQPLGVLGWLARQDKIAQGADGAMWLS